MSFKIVTAIPSDSFEIAALVNGAYRGETARQGWTHEADMLDGTRTDADAIEDILREPGHRIMKYVDKGKTLGCVELFEDGDKLYLGMLTVRPDHQAKGIGKELMKSSEAFAKKQQCRSIYMTVISARTELVDWYVRHGYLPTGERKPFDFTDPRFGEPKQRLEFLVLEKQIK